MNVLATAEGALDPFEGGLLFVSKEAIPEIVVCCGIGATEKRT